MKENHLFFFFFQKKESFHRGRLRMRTVLRKQMRKTPIDKFKVQAVASLGRRQNMHILCMNSILKCSVAGMHISAGKETSV